MNNKTVSVKSDVILQTLMDLHKKGLKSIRNRLLLAVPQEFFKDGTDLWWERAELEADEDIKQGRVSKPYTDMDELIRDLHKGILRKS